jgi:hypothetical protein
MYAIFLNTLYRVGLKKLAVHIADYWGDHTSSPLTEADGLPHMPLLPLAGSAESTARTLRVRVDALHVRHLQRGCPRP